jgi:dihydrodipicolinate reductase
VRVAVVGHGKMGLEVEAVLRERGLDALPVHRGESFPRDCPVGIDFTRRSGGGDQAAALAAGARYVVGTTGWGPGAAAACGREEGRPGSPPTSLGVNLFYRIARRGRAAGALPEYDPYILPSAPPAERTRPRARRGRWPTSWPPPAAPRSPR